MPRKPNTDQRRAEIVAAMLSVIASSGYDKATIQAVARQAGLAPGLIHYHFASKREILLALVDTLAGYIQARYSQAAGSAATPADKLRAYLNARLAHGKGANPQAVAAWVVIGAEAIRDAKVREAYQAAIAAEMTLLRSLLAAYMAEEGKSGSGAPRLAAVLMAFIEGAFQLSSAAREAMPKGYAADSAMQLVERVVSGEPRAKG